MPWCDTHAMAEHLKLISAEVAPGAHAILLLDQAGWHTSSKLAVPDNITLVPIPPRSPELNPPFRRLLRNRLTGEGRERLAVHAR